MPIRLDDWIIRTIKARGLSYVKGKLGPNWDSPYKVIDIVKLGTFRLESPEGVPVSRPWNADNLKMFHVYMAFVACNRGIICNIRGIVYSSSHFVTGRTTRLN